MDQAICKGVTIHSLCWLCQRRSQVTGQYLCLRRGCWSLRHLLASWRRILSGRGHAISLAGAGIAHIVLHTGPWKKLAGYGPHSSFLLSQHPRVSSHLQGPTSATSYSPWGRAGGERPQAPIASDCDFRRGTEQPWESLCWRAKGKPKERKGHRR